MSQRLRSRPYITATLATALIVSGGGAWSEDANPSPPPPNQSAQPPSPAQETPGELYGKLLQVPVTTLIPGNVTVNPNIQAPKSDEPQSASRGMRYFTAFNCVGCHAANGGGGMGPSLSNRAFIYGSAPENIYLTIVQGRPRGMPAWGTVLPDNIVWDLVAYVQSISKAPSKEWGTTFSTTSPSIEQVPAEFQHTPDPWRYTQKFKSGQNPR
jgi:cytochrome c oxidase cbb3-type subunit III